MSFFHFLRPWWLALFFPLLSLGWWLFRQSSPITAWSKVCDSHLLPYLMEKQGKSRHTFCLILLLSSAIFMIFSLAGPSWSRLPVPTYLKMQPRVVVLNMSESMLVSDLSPDRITRAKFKLHDLFKEKDVGQFALIAYTGEPFVVSPLTDDGQTIDALLSSLTPDIMPVEGEDLSQALEEAYQLITSAGFRYGQVLVLTGTVPSKAAVDKAQELLKLGIHTSVIPIMSLDSPLSVLFKPLATAGGGQWIPFSNTSSDLDQWLRTTEGKRDFATNGQNEMPVWKDEGRWFLIPACFLLLPVFRRGWFI